jgi:hypothetical protein
MPLTEIEVDAAVPIGGTPSRSAVNAALKELIADIAAAIATAQARAGHSGTQAASTISDFSSAADARIAAALLTALADVTITSASVGDGLRHNGTVFVNVKGEDLVRTVEGTTDTPTTADEGKIVRFTNAGANTCVISPDLSGTMFVAQWLAGAGTVTFDAQPGVNLNGLGDGVNIVGSQAAGFMLFLPTGAATWDVGGSIGDLVVADLTDSSAVGRDVLTAADEESARAAIDAAGTSQTFGYGTTFPTGDDDIFVLDADADFEYTITASVSECDSGSATYRLQINGVNVGTTANTVGTSKDTQPHSTANVVAAGDTVQLVRSADASCVMGRIKVKCTRLLA